MNQELHELTVKQKKAHFEDTTYYGIRFGTWELIDKVNREWLEQTIDSYPRWDTDTNGIKKHFGLVKSPREEAIERINKIVKDSHLITTKLSRVRTPEEITTEIMEVYDELIAKGEGE